MEQITVQAAVVPTSPTTVESPRRSHKKPNRTAQACVRCRRQKLRCTPVVDGSHCERCQRRGVPCQMDEVSPRQSPLLPPSPAQVLPSTGEQVHMLPVPPPLAPSDISVQNPSSNAHLSLSAFFNNADRSAPLPQQSTPSPTSARQSRHPPKGIDSPAGTESTDRIGTGGSTGTIKSGDMRPSGFDHLLEAGAQSSERYIAPFRPLLHQPKDWANQTQSTGLDGAETRESPLDLLAINDMTGAEITSSDNKNGSASQAYNELDFLTPELVDALFIQYKNSCGQFVPVVDLSQVGLVTSLRKRHPLLFLAILSISARFCVTHSNQTSIDPLSISELDYSRLRDLAERHLGMTLLRKRHTVSDVQATILLAGWGLHSGGLGPDGWILTGHAVRMAKRLGMDRTLSQIPSQVYDVQSSSRKECHAWITAWRTWLCLYWLDGFLSVGCGRPESGISLPAIGSCDFLYQRRSTTSNGTVIEDPNSCVYADAYIASQVELTTIGKNFVEVSATMNEQIKLNNNDFESVLSNTLAMLTEMNKQIDAWSEKWLWNASSNAIYLASHSRNSRLFCEHLRICVNGFALRVSKLQQATRETQALLLPFLKMAMNSATSTIQLHSDSSLTDKQLSFATDYLTIALAQAAIFLVQLSPKPSSKTTTGITSPQLSILETSVVGHYLTTAIELLVRADRSATGLSTYLAQTLQEISEVADIGVTASSFPETTNQVLQSQGVTFQRSRNDDLNAIVKGGSSEFMLPLDWWLSTQGLFDLDVSFRQPQIQ